MDTTARLINYETYRPLNTIKLDTAIDFTLAHSQSTQLLRTLQHGSAIFLHPGNS